MVYKFIDIYDYQSVSSIKNICNIKTREHAYLFAYYDISMCTLYKFPPDIFTLYIDIQYYFIEMIYFDKNSK